MIKISL